MQLKTTANPATTWSLLWVNPNPAAMAKTPRVVYHAHSIIRSWHDPLPSDALFVAAQRARRGPAQRA